MLVEALVDVRAQVIEGRAQQALVLLQGQVAVLEQLHLVDIDVAGLQLPAGRAELAEQGAAFVLPAALGVTEVAKLGCFSGAGTVGEVCLELADPSLLTRKSILHFLGALVGERPLRVAPLLQEALELGAPLTKLLSSRSFVGQVGLDLRLQRLGAGLDILADIGLQRVGFLLRPQGFPAGLRGGGLALSELFTRRFGSGFEFVSPRLKRGLRRLQSLAVLALSLVEFGCVGLARLLQLGGELRVLAEQVGVCGLQLGEHLLSPANEPGVGVDLTGRDGLRSGNQVRPERVELLALRGQGGAFRFGFLEGLRGCGLLLRGPRLLLVELGGALVERLLLRLRRLFSLEDGHLASVESLGGHRVRLDDAGQPTLQLVEIHCGRLGRGRR